jgi:hypothetical protein
VNILNYKVIAFAISAAIGAVGGCFYARWSMFLSPDMFKFWESFLVLCMVVLGGSGQHQGRAGRRGDPGLPGRSAAGSAHRPRPAAGNPFHGLWPDHGPDHALQTRRLFPGHRFQRPLQPPAAGPAKAHCRPAVQERTIVTPLLELHGISKRFGGLLALADVSFEVHRGRDPRPDRTQRRGQDHHVQLHHRGVSSPPAAILSFPERPVHAHQWLQAGKNDRTGHCPHLSEHPPVQRPDRLDNVRIARHCRTKSNFLRSVLRTPFQQGPRRRKSSRTPCAGCDFVGLGHHALADASSLSYGDQRRLEIARSLATEPRNCFCWMNRPPA